MNIFKLSIKNIISKPLSSLLSLALLVFGIGIISLLLQLNSLIKTQMDNNLKGIDMVVGAKGSPLQLILSAVYHIDSPTGNISVEDDEKIKNIFGEALVSEIQLSESDASSMLKDCIDFISQNESEREEVLKDKYSMQELSSAEKRELQQIILKKDRMSQEEAALIKNLSSK